MIDTTTLAQIMTLIITVVAFFFAYQFGYFKHKFSAFRTLVVLLDNAWADDKITDKELEIIIESLKRLKEEC